MFLLLISFVYLWVELGWVGLIFTRGDVFVSLYRLESGFPLLMVYDSPAFCFCEECSVMADCVVD